MHQYKKILVAVDIYSTYQPVIERAIKLAKSANDISLIHVNLPSVYFEPYGAAFQTDFIEDIQAQSDEKLKTVAKKYRIPDSQVHNVLGYPAEEIQAMAKQLDVELIVIGTHGRSGIKLLLGSTANAVLHGVERDVLAVKI